LIVLNIGLELGLISTALFTMLVLMAIVTTFMAGPALRLIDPRRELSEPPDEAFRRALGGGGTPSKRRNARSSSRPRTTAAPTRCSHWRSPWRPRSLRGSSSSFAFCVRSPFQLAF